MLKYYIQFFGGRGASSGGNSLGVGGQGPKYKNELGLPDGSKIEYEGTLQYGGKDAGLSEAQRASVENWENKRYTNKIEFSIGFDKDGNALGPEAKGGKGSVRTPSLYHNVEGGAFTHNHPREAGLLGGTFSQGDLRNFANGKTPNSRATAKEGTYSISKTKNFNREGFLSYVQQAQRDFDSETNTKGKALREKIKSGKVSYENIRQESAKVFNTALVNLHNKYLAGQKQFGYTYTLEKR